AEGRPEPAERSHFRPRLDRRGEETHAHVAGRDHPREALGARALVVGEAGRPLVRSARVRAHLVLREEDLAPRQVGPLLDPVEAPAHRCMKRLSTTATISPRWFVIVKRITTKYMLPVRPVFSYTSWSVERTSIVSPGRTGTPSSMSFPASKPVRTSMLRGMFSG